MINKFEFIKKYVGAIGHFDPRLTIISAHVRFALNIKNGFTGA
ncbi:hypothetical protein [Pseudoalteromonas marina]|nr:hypothetical protein [Pseudoalteromonas marina]